MRLSCVSAGPLPPLLLLLLLLTPPAAGLLVSGRRGQDRRLYGVSPAVSLTGVGQAQCQLACQQHGNCRSFNYHASTGDCQLFTVTACDSNSYYVGQMAGWTWFDVVADLRAESRQTLWEQEVCVQDGRCRDSCLRQLGQGCRHVQQCEHLISGSVQCGDSTCKCATDHWQYNETLCLPKDQQLFTDGEYWVWKKMVNGLCSTEFDVKAADTVQIVLSDAYTHSSNRYAFKITTTSISANRFLHDNSDVLFGLSQKSLLSGSEFVRLGLHWCNGQIRLWQVGDSTMFVNWNDHQRLSPTHMALWSAPNTEGRWRFPEKLVDPWFDEDWSLARIYSIPRDTWLLRRRTEQDFWVEFECRIWQDCNWMARTQTTWHNADIWKVIIGGWDNSQSDIYRHTASNDDWTSLTRVDTPAILSRTEFRRFRIHFSPGSVSVYKADETEPFMAVTGQTPFTINYDGPHMCCNDGNVEVRLVQYDAGWGYEGGFRWGENLVD